MSCYQHGTIPIEDPADPPFRAVVFERSEQGIRVLSIPRHPVLGAYPVLRRAAAAEGFTTPERQAIHLFLGQQRAATAARFDQ